MYSRNNSSTRAIIDSRLYAEGTCKNVYRGRYIKGPRTGQECVAKEFKTGSVFADHYFNEELNVVQRTQSIINSWHAAGIIDSRIVLNTPEIWEYTSGGKKTLVEPFIRNFQKFNSNTGWAPVTNNVWGEAMQALSHFSYHSTGGQFLLCDLQGGSYEHGYILTDPIIMSWNYDCGPGDLGPKGICSFFLRHRCGRFCRPHWIRPPMNVGVPFTMARGTTMTNRVTARTAARTSRVRSIPSTRVTRTTHRRTSTRAR